MADVPTKVANTATIKAIATQIRATTVNVSSLTAETWNDIFQLASIVAGVITLVAGVFTFAVLVGTVMTGRRVNKQQAEKLATLEREAADARLKQRDAERSLAELQAKLQWRSFSEEQRGRFLEILAQRPKGGITITCLNENPESCAFAAEIADQLRSVGWEVDGPFGGFRLWLVAGRRRACAYSWRISTACRYIWSH